MSVTEREIESERRREGPMSLGLLLNLALSSSVLDSANFCVALSNAATAALSSASAFFRSYER